MYYIAKDSRFFVLTRYIASKVSLGNKMKGSNIFERLKSIILLDSLFLIHFMVFN